MIPDYILPSLELLNPPVGQVRAPGLSEDQLYLNLALIIETLQRFGVKAEGRVITPGATVTRYEVCPDEGVRMDKITSLKNDLARVLCAERVTIIAPIPGKDTVGIDIANSRKVNVFLREVLESQDWRTVSAKLPIALGKDDNGKTIVVDLADMPHILIGGTTGSGKSVCINSIIMSFLFRFAPDELRLILIDPNRVEMQAYNPIPHLVVPIVTDPKKVSLALRWASNEMGKRYRTFANVGVNDIAAFNARVFNAARMRCEDDIVAPDKLPYLVIIVDGLTDLMQSDSIKEATIALLTGARGAGIHFIVGTQTTRHEVITGFIKSNIPAVIAFHVPSRIDSRVILDENGAEALFGNGDFLYRESRSHPLVRGQGAFVSDQEIRDVVEFVSAQAEAQFSLKLDAKLSGKAPAEMEISDDAKKLVHECFDVIRQERKASTSNLQRRLRLGYNRAAYVIDYLEKMGVLGPPDGAKPREILVNLDTFVLNI